MATNLKEINETLDLIRQFDESINQSYQYIERYQSADSVADPKIVQDIATHRTNIQNMVQSRTKATENLTELTANLGNNLDGFANAIKSLQEQEKEMEAMNKTYTERMRYIKSELKGYNPTEVLAKSTVLYMKFDMKQMARICDINKERIRKIEAVLRIIENHKKSLATVYNKAIAVLLNKDNVK